jgi:hypothetical protein
MNRWSSLATSHTKLLAVVVVLLFGRITIADTASPQLVSISAISSGATPQVVFAFDSDVHSYSVSTYTLTTAAGGVATSSPPALAILDPNSPKTISVPLNFVSLASADSVRVSLTLNDNINPPIPIKSSYFLDLSFLKAVKGYQDSILTLQKAKEDVQAQLTQCQTDRANLISKHSPNQFDYLGADLVGPTTVILHYTTDVYATIQVTDQSSNKMVPSVGVDHHVKFVNLAPSTPHTFMAVAFDAFGNPMSDPAFTKKTTVPTPDPVAFAPTITKLVASGPTAITATVDFDPTGALPSNFKGYIVLHYTQLVDSNASLQPIAHDAGDGALDANGVPKGTSYSGTHDFTISGLTAGATYLVTFTAYDEYGDVAKFPLPGRAVTTDKANAPLAFAGPIGITMNTDTGLTVSWSANRTVSNSALKIVFADGSFLPNVPKGTTGSQNSSVTVDLTGLSALLDKAVSNPKPPEFDISMDDGTNSPDGKAAIAFSVSFVVTSTKQAKSPVQTAANKVSESAQKGSKIKWADVISTGLGILAKVI